MDWKARGVVVSFAGVYDFPTASRASEELYADRRSNDLKYIIFDLSSVERLDFSLGQTEFPAMRDKISSVRLPEMRKGFVATDESAASLCQQYVEKSLAMGSPWKFLVSDCLQEVLKWADTSGSELCV